MTVALVASIVAVLLCGACCYIQSLEYDALSLAGALLFGFVAVIGFIGAGIYWAEQSACEDRAGALDREWRYGMLAGCLVRTDAGQLVPLDNLRFNEQGEVVDR